MYFYQGKLSKATTCDLSMIKTVYLHRQIHVLAQNRHISIHIESDTNFPHTCTTIHKFLVTLVKKLYFLPTALTNFTAEVDDEDAVAGDHEHQHYCLHQVV